MGHPPVVGVSGEFSLLDKALPFARATCRQKIITVSGVVVQRCTATRFRHLWLPSASNLRYNIP